MSWREYIDREQERFVADLLDFIRIPSVSAVPEHAPDVKRAAQWIADRLKKSGLENVVVLPTAGHPCVYADWLHAGPDKPTVLIYGHFDVQPAEPFDLWTSPPFEPEIRDERVYGRGASDDKGSLLTSVFGVEALLATEKALPVNVKFLFEGQEEIGSPDLPPFVEEHRERLAADMIFSADGLQWSADTPQLVMGLKGLVGLDIVVTGPHSDQHSGLHGGGIANPALALGQILASLKSADGRITVDNFYDDVLPLTDEDRAAMARIPYDEADYLAQSGAPATAGEPGYTTYERLWARPTLDVNGIFSGWQGAGTKTVLPAQATAKITCRLVAGQSPQRVVELISKHVERHLPSGVTAKVIHLPGDADPFIVPYGHNSSQIAANVLEEVYNRKPYIARLGGSIPVMQTLLDVLGVHATMFGFSHGDENLHAPDEFFRLPVFRQGQIAYARLLLELGRTNG